MSDKPTSSKQKPTKGQAKGEHLNVDTSGMSDKERAELAESLVRPAGKCQAATKNVKKVGQNAGEQTATPAKKARAKREPKVDGRRQPGRPSDYSQELADRICAELAEGKSMRTVCIAEDMPVMSTVFKWLRERKEFSEQYTKAKMESADALVEEMVDIADDGRNDWMEAHDKDGEFVGYKVNGDHIQRSRLRVETRKWIAAKLKPKKYGEKVDMNHGVQPDNPLASLLAQVAGTHMTPKSDKDGE